MQRTDSYTESGREMCAGTGRARYFTKMSFFD
jgi:hypothetical protein